MQQTLPAGRRSQIRGWRWIRSVNRTLSFYIKWVAEIVRQPVLMATLIVGPFLILLAFGEGVKLGAPPPRTMIVTPADAGQTRLEPLPEELSRYLTIVGTTTDPEAARRMLRNGDAELVAILPPDPLAAVENGEHARVKVLTDDIDPVRRSYTRSFLREQVATLNQQTIQKAIEDAQRRAGELQPALGSAHQAVAAARSASNDLAAARGQLRTLKAVTDALPSVSAQAVTAMTGAAFVIPGLDGLAADARSLAQSADALKRNVDALDARLAGGGPLPSAEELTQIDAQITELDQATTKLRAIPPEVLSAPFQAEVENIAPFQPTYISFYAPAVLALLVQHLAITLGALSMARIRLLGLMELLQTSPVRPGEVVVGNYLSYGTLCLIAAAALLGLLVVGLGVPVFGSWLVVGAMLGLLILCSLGIGFAISMLAGSEQQAAQVAMLILIATVFFSGFVVPSDTITWPARALSYLLPATYAIRTLQDVMLRGVLRSPQDLAVLAAVAVTFFFLTVQLFRREYRPR